MPFRRTRALEGSPDLAGLGDPHSVLWRAAIYSTTCRKEKLEAVHGSLYRILKSWGELYEGFYRSAQTDPSETLARVLSMDYVYHMAEMSSAPAQVHGYRIYIFRSVTSMRESVSRALAESVLET